ncbi:phenylalanine--tRNA ligase subunit alpha [Candidatus Woesearchaeota archaeon]|nr:phenylalanine--tRNA ligase subunit alpha [Candidatus Woesearchaeota archaeon]
MSLDKIIASLHPLERKVLPVLKETDDFEIIAEKSGLQKVEVMRALQWLQNKKLIVVNQKLNEQISLDENGLNYKEKGVPEKKFLEAIKRKTSLEDLRKKSGLSNEELNICLGMLKRKNAIDIHKEKGIFVSITSAGKELVKKSFPEEIFLKKSFPINVSELQIEDKEVFEDLKKRKKILRINIVKIIKADLTEQGKKIASKRVSGKDILDQLTSKSLKSREWKNKKLRSYDVEINVPNISGGKRHFVSQATQYIKKIWLDMGFKEMTGNYVQTSFWDLDALFVPQDHPARDEQDTFFIKDPSHGSLPKKFAEKIKDAHENGANTGSKGWQYKWSSEEAKKNLLRTHTTVLSAKTIASLKKEDLPAKFFSVGKVFRNETLSWKHLFEFIQVEGIVIDPDANFKNLKGYLKEFFAKMGFSDVRIRPAHFPYTEPSAEVDVWHPTKKQWVELGGSGIFRPELVKPLLGIEVPVLAWGLGMERTIMEYYNITDARDVYKNDIKQLRETKLWMK